MVINVGQTNHGESSLTKCWDNILGAHYTLTHITQHRRSKKQRVISISNLASFPQRNNLFCRAFRVLPKVIKTIFRFSNIWPQVTVLYIGLRQETPLCSFLMLSYLIVAHGKWVYALWISSLDCFQTIPYKQLGMDEQKHSEW